MTRINRTLITDAVKQCASIVSRKGCISPGVLVVEDCKALKVEATDLQLSLSTIVPIIEGAQKEPIHCNARTLLSALSAFSSDEIELECSQVGVEIYDEKHRIELACMPSIDFPGVPSGSENTAITCDQWALADAIQGVAYAAHEDEDRTHINGVLCEIGEGAIIATATDGHRMARYNVEDFTAPARVASVLLPLRSVEKICSILQNVDGRMTIGEGLCCVSGGLSQFSTQLKHGKFPPAEKLLRSHSTIETTIERKPFIDALQAAKVVRIGDASSVQMDLGTTTIEIKATTEKGHCKSVVQCSQMNAHMVVNVNPTYMIEALNGIATDDVSLGINDEEEAILIKDTSETTKMIAVVMPMKF